MAATVTTRRRFQRCYYVYILASLSGTLYVGSTDDLRKRMVEHKLGSADSFTKKYNVNRLMYFEIFRDAANARNREIQIKKYRREKKIALFAVTNPKWKDLSADILDAAALLRRLDTAGDKR
ncbi:MAG TPA: GIY-YIG nuclease family protein [Verrucomicrobiae bacterium]|jgi:putative endonuclease|nr:GIY-YIG nuclease family protein [Verrucomicrobiae bacterium]